MATGNIDHVDINSLSDTPLNQIKPVEDLPTEGTVSSPTGEQDISNAPLQISSSRRISLKTLAQYFDHILSQNNTLRNLKFKVEEGESGNTEVDIDTAFNKLISEISNGEISNISQILGDPKMTNSIWLFLVKTLYDLSKSQLDSFKSYTGFPADLPNPSSLGIHKDIFSILIGLDKFIAGEDNLKDWGITSYRVSDMFPLIVNKLWPLDNKNDNVESINLWDNITSIAERIYYLFKWTFSSEDPTLEEIMKRPWETGNKTLYERIVSLENAVGISEGDNLTTRVSNLENKLLLLYKNSLAKRKEVVVDPLSGILTIKGGTDYIYTSIYDPIDGANLISSISMPSELVIDFNDFLYENSLDSEGNINISQLNSNNITPIDPNKATVYFEIDHIIPYITDSNVSVNTGTRESKISSNKSSITNSISKASQTTELPDKPFQPGGGSVVVPIQRGNNVNYILGNGLNDITLTLNNKPNNLRVLIHEPIVNGGINPGQSISPSYENTLFGNLDNDYTNGDISNGMGYFKLEFIYNPPKSINITSAGFEGDYYTYPTLEVNIHIKLSFNPPS